MKVRIAVIAVLTMFIACSTVVPASAYNSTLIVVCPIQTVLDIEVKDSSDVETIIKYENYEGGSGITGDVDGSEKIFVADSNESGVTIGSTKYPSAYLHIEGDTDGGGNLSTAGKEFEVDFTIPANKPFALRINANRSAEMILTVSGDDTFGTTSVTYDAGNSNTIRIVGLDKNKNLTLGSESDWSNSRIVWLQSDKDLTVHITGKMGTQGLFTAPYLHMQIFMPVSEN